MVAKESDALFTIVIAPELLSWLPEQLVGAYALSSTDVISAGSERLIVFESSEQRLTHLTVGILERLALIKPPWKRRTKDYIISTGSREDGGDAEFQPATKPRNPNPKPMSCEMDVPLK